MPPPRLAFFVSASHVAAASFSVSLADAPRPDGILVVMAIADGGRLHNRCGTEPIR
jgi:hypothetical protein